MKTPLLGKMGRRNLLFGGAAVPFLLGATGCGYLLYPDRRGRTGGDIDTPIFIVDLLWLLPGIVPGVICLIVDFTTGCIYRHGGRARNDMPAGTDEQRLASALVAIDGAVVADGAVHKDRRAELRWTQSIDETALRTRGKLVMRRADGATAEAMLSDLI